ncbi:MAG: Hsp70 family protein [Verrucomicrobiales bacterium]
MICGIDLGTTNSSIGVVEAGFPILLADESGSRLTPSAVYFPPDDAKDPVIGAPALRQRVLHPGRVVTSIKRLMGMAAVIGPRRLRPEQISALILGRLKALGESAMGQPLDRAVITVPAYFNEAQRAATKRAGEQAGFAVERILNEPTAAALAYGLDKLDERSRVAVYDLGGGTFDISILELRAGVFEVLSTSGDTKLGGDDVDAAVFEHLASLAGPPGDATGRARLEEAVVNAKHALSSTPSHTLELPFYRSGESVRIELSRDQLEGLARPIIDRTRAHCRRALADARLDASDLDEVVLVGGATRMPLVRDTVRGIFGHEPNTSQHPDEAVALGATIQAGIIDGSLRQILLLDVTPLSLGLETFGGLMNVLIPRNTTIPCKAGELFTNAVPNQPSMLVRVLQGEREMARDNWELGHLEIDFVPGPKGSARVGVQFEIDQNGLLRVLARDTKTGTDRVLEIRSTAVDVDDERVERMIAESVENAFDDMRARVLTEARQKAEEMLPALEAAMAQAGSHLSPGERSAIDAAAAETHQALASGDAARLKAAVTALDRATEHLAALIVERAMEESLARRGIL